MERAVVTQNLLELIAGREVRAAVFTTYTFEPDFFELEVVPVLLNQNSVYSEDDRVKRFMVRENLREAGLPIDVYYDLPMFRKSGSGSPEMEYLCHGINLGNRAFHGKVNMILVKNREAGRESLLLGAGSNNLSRSGWWDNIECQYWHEINSGEISRMLRTVVLEDIEFLDGYSELSTAKSKTAIGKIRDFVLDCRYMTNADPVYYFGLSYPEKRGRFLEFLKHRTSPIVGVSDDNPWHLEIVSPFFVDSDSGNEHQNFFKMGVAEITILLPTDDEGSALCRDGYYRHLESQDGVSWGQWQEDVRRSLGLADNYYRPLHAKIYHFYRSGESWIFVGSVNFTHMAMHKNVEAGFLVRQSKVTRLLEAFDKGTMVEKFADLDESAPGANPDMREEAKIPDLFLRYDWLSKKLSGRTGRYMAYVVEILGPEGLPVIEPWALKFQECGYEGDIRQLEVALRNGSFVKVRGYNSRRKDKAEFPEHTVLLQQVGWSHKPLNLPALSAAQILAIYAGMSAERRQMLLIDAKIKALVLSAQGGELTVNDSDRVVDQFFSEYAEIFRAFRQLRDRLEKALQGEADKNGNFTGQNHQWADYYLTGSGVDSLPALLSNALDNVKQGSLSAATYYLLCLSALEIYENKRFAIRPNVKTEVRKLQARIKTVKKGDHLALVDNSAANRRQFFKWFEEQFSRSSTVVGKSS